MSDFSPSINIKRDSKAILEYFVTPNSQKVFEMIVGSFQGTAQRSFNVIGSYGTGKSAFLLALQKTLSGKQDFFSDFPKNDLPLFEFMPFVGEYTSIIGMFAKKLGLNVFADSSLVVEAIEQYYGGLEADKGLVLVVDEFGKLLEYALKHNPDRELYFLQQLAELVNDSSRNILWINTLHQGVSAYAFGQSEALKNEWVKVGGRFKDISFNEPVEQLLWLAASKLQSQEKVLPTNTNMLVELVTKHDVFPLSDYLSEQIAKKVYPLDILSASMLVLGLREYGQNERSLFSFLNKKEYLNTQNFTFGDKPVFFDLGFVYDYLVCNHQFVISGNSQHKKWAAIRDALSRIEALDLDEHRLGIAVRLIKVVGLLDIFCKASANISKNFLVEYLLQTSSNDSKTTKDLFNLLDLEHRIITYRRYLGRYVLTEGTDIDVESELAKMENFVGGIGSLAEKLAGHISLPCVPASRYFHKTGNPRFFAFKVTSTPQPLIPDGQTDGFINIVVGGETSQEEIISLSKEHKEAVLYGFYMNPERLRLLLVELEKIKQLKVREDIDRVAFRELSDLFFHYCTKLERTFARSLYGDQSIQWYFRGKKIDIPNQRSFNWQLSVIFEKVYSASPVIHFEMVNKTKLSSTMQSARKKFIRAMIAQTTEESLGFDAKKYPPQKTIYQILLRQPGIHHKGKLQNPTDPSFLPFWQAGEQFLSSTRLGKRNLGELVELWSRRPFKLKKGAIACLLPIFLFAKKDDYALFNEHSFVPAVNADNLELIIKKPEKFTVKAFNLEGVRLEVFNQYRGLLGQYLEQTPGKQDFIDTIKPFLAFCRQLPSYTLHTKNLSVGAIALRQAIVSAKDFEKTFFEDFPSALGYNLANEQNTPALLREYVPALQEAIRELREAFDNLIERFGRHLRSLFGFDENSSSGFDEYRETIAFRYQGIKNHLLEQKHKIFLGRLLAQISDKRDWLLAVAQAGLGKKLELAADDDEKKLLNQVGRLVYDLDQFVSTQLNVVDQSREIAFEVEIKSLSGGKINAKTSFVRLPIGAKQEVEQLKIQIRQQMGANTSLNIAALAQLMGELARREGGSDDSI